jgi:hypothetical protein
MNTADGSELSVVQAWVNRVVRNEVKMAEEGENETDSTGLKTTVVSEAKKKEVF